MYQAGSASSQPCLELGMVFKTQQWTAITLSCDLTSSRYFCRCSRYRFRCCSFRSLFLQPQEVPLTPPIRLQLAATLAQAPELVQELEQALEGLLAKSKLPGMLSWPQPSFPALIPFNCSLDLCLELLNTLDLPYSTYSTRNYSFVLAELSSSAIVLLRTHDWTFVILLACFSRRNYVEQSQSRRKQVWILMPQLHLYMKASVWVVLTWCGPLLRKQLATNLKDVLLIAADQITGFACDSHSYNWMQVPRDVSIRMWPVLH